MSAQPSEPIAKSAVLWGKHQHTGSATFPGQDGWQYGVVNRGTRYAPNQWKAERERWEGDSHHGQDLGRYNTEQKAKDACKAACAANSQFAPIHAEWNLTQNGLLYKSAVSAKARVSA